MSYSLNSLGSEILKGGYIADCTGSIIGVTKADTWSLDYSSFRAHVKALASFKGDIEVV